MSLILFDSVTVTDIPNGAQAIAGYVGGLYPTWQPLIAKFPHLPALSIAVNASQNAQCLDVEKGDATPADVPSWLARVMKLYPHVTPILYTSAAQVAAVRKAAGTRRCLIWSAHYTSKPHICAPKICGYPAADATQYANHGPNGGHYDMTLMSPEFFAAIAHRGTSAPKEPTVTKTPAQAVAAAAAQSKNGPAFREGTCLEQVQKCYMVPPSEPSAAAAWANAKHKHLVTNPYDIPFGVPVFWTGGSHGFGHIAISTGNAEIWSSDINRVGWFDHVRTADIGRKWGLTLVGWTEDLEGVRVWSPPPAPAKETVVPIKPGVVTSTPYSRTWTRIHDAVTHPDVAAIAKGRVPFRAFVAATRVGLNRFKKN